MGKKIGGFDWLTLVFLLALACFGLFLLLTTDKSLFYQQLLYVIVSCFVFLIVSMVDRVVLTWFSPFAYILCLVLLLLSYLGPEIRGATRWIFIGPIRLQPSELVKPLLILFFSWLSVKKSPRIAKNIPIHIGFFIIPFLLVFKQPDLGSSLVYVLFWIGILVAGGLPIRYLVFSIISSFLLLPGLWNLMAGYQKDRILTFINPAIDPQGAGYNAIQSMITVGSGQLFGRGLGLGTQSHLRFLPEYHTDFIFATLAEELGFLGAIVLILIYAVLLWRLLLLCWGNSHDLLVYVFGSGLFFMILSQLFINIGMNIGLLPITGITLPFVSYGGSSLLSLSLSFGVLNALINKRGEIKSVAIR
ncbi:FtsW/RodA/SpoVE family cell cycle protein [Patescibacteria group bacterium]